ncbi:hypothetical protein CC86DRAFT_455293 [Ophiobolus disseminans]|uniref:Uncharacterized protein n=1 Tax=Ophiobolus disseminans TaxID=1469910 RepID=A0A6A7A306_9PLEO|nr:hypothetical protein CC86DRAFT_455293 [Ophiobolus disseminans]
MSAPPSPRDLNLAVDLRSADKAETRPIIVKVDDEGADKIKAASSSPARESSRASTPPSSTSSMDGDADPTPDRAVIVVALKVPDSPRRNKGTRKHIEESIVTLDLISKGGMGALKKRSGTPESDTSSLSEAPSSPGSDMGSVDVDMRDADDTDVEEPATGKTTMSFDEKISAAVAVDNQSKFQSKPTPQKAAGKKHRITPPVSGSEKKSRSATKRDRSAEASIEVQKLPYQSIISLLMPPRPSSIPGNPIPEPDPANLPFGDTEDYHNSMIIHYMDECEMTYTKAAEVYSAKFPRDAVTDEAVRKRHIRSLLRLKKKYGCRDPDTIPRPSKAVVRRGTPRAKKVSLITPVIIPTTSTTTSAAAATSTFIPPPTTPTTPGTQPKSGPKQRKLSPRLLEKTLIVTWHDDAGLGWKDIQNKLEDAYQWSLGQGTIEKYYYTTLERVYGKGGKKEMKVEKREEGEGDGGREDGDFGGLVERLVERRMSF